MQHIDLLQWYNVVFFYGRSCLRIYSRGFFGLWLHLEVRITYPIIFVSTSVSLFNTIRCWWKFVKSYLPNKTSGASEDKYEKLICIIRLKAHMSQWHMQCRCTFRLLQYFSCIRQKKSQIQTYIYNCGIRHTSHLFWFTTVTGWSNKTRGTQLQL